MLRHPTFPQDELDKIKQQLFALLATIEKNPSRFASSLFNRAIYGEQSPMGMVWTPELVSSFSVDTIREFHAREVAPDNMSVFMIGDITMDEARASVENAFGGWKGAAESGLRPVGEAAPPAARVILVDQPGAPQSTIIAGHAIGPYDAEISTELTLVNGVFGALRAGGVASLFAKTLIPGLLTGSICCIEGFRVTTAVTEVPQATTRALVRSVLALFLTSAVVSVLTYLPLEL